MKLFLRLFSCLHNCPLHFTGPHISAQSSFPTQTLPNCIHPHMTLVFHQGSPTSVVKSSGWRNTLVEPCGSSRSILWPETSFLICVIGISHISTGLSRKSPRTQCCAWHTVNVPRWVPCSCLVSPSRMLDSVGTQMGMWRHAVQIRDHTGSVGKTLSRISLPCHNSSPVKWAQSLPFNSSHVWDLEIELFTTQVTDTWAFETSWNFLEKRESWAGFFFVIETGILKTITVWNKTHTRHRYQLEKKLLK